MGTATSLSMSMDMMIDMHRYFGGGGCLLYYCVLCFFKQNLSCLVDSSALMRSYPL